MCVLEFQAKRGQSRCSKGKHNGGRQSAAHHHHLPPFWYFLARIHILSHIKYAHTHNNRIHIETHTHTGGHNGAPTLFHSLLIFGLTERPSERRPHMNVAERETGRDKDKE